MAALARRSIASSALEAMLERYAYVREAEAFADLAERELVSRRDFDLRLASHELDPGSRAKRASTLFLALDAGRARVVDGLTYRLGDALFVDEEYGRCVNLATAVRHDLPADPEVEDDIRPWLELAGHVLSDPRSFNDATCWLAWVLQNPGRRPARHLVIGGAPTIGKSLLLEPLRAGVGPANFEEQTSEHYAQFGRRTPPRRVRVVLDELSGGVTRRRHKALTHPTAAPVVVAAAGLKPYRCADTSTVVAFTHCAKTADRLAEDPNLLTLWSPARPISDEFDAEVRAWYEAGGAVRVARWLAGLDLKTVDPTALTTGTLVHGYGGFFSSCLDRRILEAAKAARTPFSTEIVALPEVVEHFAPGLSGSAQRDAIRHVARLLAGQTEGRPLGARRLGRTPKNCSRPLRCLRGEATPLFAMKNADAHLRGSAGEMVAAFWAQRAEIRARPLSHLERPWLRLAFVSNPAETAPTIDGRLEAFFDGAAPSHAGERGATGLHVVANSAGRGPAPPVRGPAALSPFKRENNDQSSILGATPELRPAGRHDSAPDVFHQ